MKKAFLLAWTIVLCLAFSAHALPLWNEESGWYDSSVHDRSDTESELDLYYEDFYGYKYIGDTNTENEYSGYYLGTIGGNTRHHMLNAINYYLAFRGLAYEYIQKTKVDDIESPGPGSDTYGQLQVDWDEDLFSGSWKWTSENDFEVTFYAVMGGNEFALYLVDPIASEGSWTARHLLNNGGNIPDISHFSVATTNPGLTPIPEPTTILMFGTGLLVLAWMGRRKMQQKKYLETA